WPALPAWMNIDPHAAAMSSATSSEQNGSLLLAATMDGNGSGSRGYGPKVIRCFGRISGLATSGGATRNAPATGLRNRAMAWSTVGTPREWAISTTGLVAPLTASARVAVQCS